MIHDIGISVTRVLSHPPLSHHSSNVFSRSRRITFSPMKKNPLKNLNVMLKLNSYAKTAKRMSLLVEKQRASAKENKLQKKRKVLLQEELRAIKASGRAFYKTMISDSDYTEFDTFTKWLGVSQ